MFNISLRYIFLLFVLFLFGTCFFSSEAFMPYLRNWKSDKLYNLSKVYQDESITNESNLLQDGVRKARIATLLDPNNKEKADNFIKLLFRVEPTEALLMWSDLFINIHEPNDEKLELVRKCLDTTRNIDLKDQEKIVAGEIAMAQLNVLEKNANWFNNPDLALLSAEVLAQIGRTQQAKSIIQESIVKHPSHVKSIFFLTRLIVHLKDSQSVKSIGRTLANLSTRRNKTGKDAIRHMTLLHLLQPLSKNSLHKCISLLSANTFAEPIDFMRIHALQYQLSQDQVERIAVVNECSNHFDLGETKEHLIFCNWLGSLGAHKEIIQFLSASQAKLDENLFQLRMNALAQLNDLESIHLEVNNSPTIPIRWRLAIEARAYALQGNYLESEKILNRLLSALGNDPRQVRSICRYLELSNDIKGLTYILEKLTDHSVHQTFALKKLIQYRSSSATLEELISWMTKLSKSKVKDSVFAQTNLYFELLDPFLPSPSEKLNSLLSQAIENFKKNQNSKQNKLILALAHLRNQSPDQALVSIGPMSDWRKWRDTRPAWAVIVAQIFTSNNDTEKSLILSQNLNLESISRAEKESLNLLFPQLFKSIQ